MIRRLLVTHELIGKSASSADHGGLINHVYSHVTWRRRG